MRVLQFGPCEYDRMTEKKFMVMAKNPIKMLIIYIIRLPNFGITVLLFVMVGGCD